MNQDPHRRHEHHGQHGQSAPPEHLPKVRPRTLTLITIVALAAMAALFLIGFLARHARIAHREAIAAEIRDRPPVVGLVRPKPAESTFVLTLPADIRPWASTALYARTNGYLASWKYDINDRVKRGDVMAVISAPDTDAQLEAARAALNQQQTNQRLAALTDQRYRGLIAIQGVTQQQLDQNRSALEQAQAGVTSAKAEVDRLEALVGFEQIAAPFDGIVTARTYDVGALISATQTGTGQEMFDVLEDDKLRVFVNVPQADVPLIKFGQEVELALERNYPGHRFKGVVARATGSLDLATRTLRTELDFPNTDPALRIYPGMYGEALFQIHRGQPILTVPTSALLIEAEGKEVAVVKPGNRIHLQKVNLGNDFGTYIEVLDGLDAHDEVVANPGEEMAEGLVVAPERGNGGS